MRILSEIVNDCVNDRMPSHEECYYALEAYIALYNDAKLLLNEQLFSEVRSPPNVREGFSDHIFKTYKTALKTSPKEWMGNNWED